MKGHNNNKHSINKKLNETQGEKKNPLTLVENSCDCKGSLPSDLSWDLSRKNFYNIKHFSTVFTTWVRGVRHSNPEAI